MRTSVVGLLDPKDLDHTESLAVEVAQLTHWDPRCVASAVAVSVAVAVLVTGGTTAEALGEAGYRAGKYEMGAVAVMGQDLWSLDLSEGLDDPARKGPPPIGFTYKCLGAGFWALRQAQEEVLVDHYGLERCKSQPIFLEMLGKVIRAGGDTDTNGAVAGALLGAYLGFKGIPRHLVDGLRDKNELDRRLAELEGSIQHLPA
jgi:ADP-ribosylglycohydrolase